MIYHVFFHQGIYSLIDEVSTSITDKCDWKPKFSNYVFIIWTLLQPFCTGLNWFYFYPFSQVFYNRNDIPSSFLWPGLGKGPKKSMAHISKVKLGFMDIKGISCCFKGLPSLWNLSHLRSWDLQSLLRVGHHNPACRIFFIIVSTWKYPPTTPKWVSSMIDCLSWSKAHC